MQSCSLYKDSMNNLWEFILKENGDLVYIRTVERGDIGREIKIDDGVLDFSLNSDNNNKVHLAYITKKGEVKYCTQDRDNWPSKALYFFKPGSNIAEEVRLQMLGGTAHIFFLFHRKEPWKDGYLLHGVWDGTSEKANTISRVSSIPGSKLYYDTEVIGGSNIYVFFLSSNSEQSLRMAFFNGSTWSSPKMLYGITGEDLDFCIAQHKEHLHVLSLSKEDDKYTLEHVLMDMTGAVHKINRIYESKLKLSDPVLLTGGDTLWAFWREEDNILYSIYEGIWTQAQEIERKGTAPIVLYNYLENSRENSNKPHMVYGTPPPNINLLLPAKGNNRTVKK